MPIRVALKNGADRPTLRSTRHDVTVRRRSIVNAPLLPMPRKKSTTPEKVPTADAREQPSAPEERLAVDDIALLLVQLEVADTVELERVRAALMSLARETDDMDAAFALGGAATQIAAAAAGDDQGRRRRLAGPRQRAARDGHERLDAAAGGAPPPHTQSASRGDRWRA